MAAAAGGDRQAFDALVRLHTPRMYRVALRIVADPADAEDVVQEAWISAWRALRGYRGDAAPATWLYRVVSNAALAQLRRRPATVPIKDGAEERLWNVDDPDVPERATLRAEEVAAVHRAVAGLEPSQRVPLVLREFEGLSYEEVAAVLEISMPAARSRVHRARQTLLTKLEGAR
ncbi:MAG TPA: sigma-70 family RNA polymerase sigma factor [Pseudonocardiaceae bacterium]|jgi:RNA polymerase sigma-70 factor (ECF subfamily)|nr:sigma-70 family RNA polymerase sigma factor [Pseudonocardiaceae bacterium]